MCLLYAADKKIMRIRSAVDCYLLLHLNTLYNYYSNSVITVNTGKCQCISFNRKTYPGVFPCHFSSIVIERTHIVQDL